MAKRNPYFTAAHNRTSAGPMGNRKPKQLDQNDVEQVKDFYYFSALRLLIVDLIKSQKSYIDINRILGLKKYSNDDIKLVYEEVTNYIDSKKDVQEP
jgi:hypothetical protein